MGKSADSRGLTNETLEGLRVGVGQEKFRNEEDGHLSLYESIYFPLYVPSKLKQNKKENRQPDSNSE